MHAARQQRIRWVGNLLLFLGGIAIPATCLWFDLRSIFLGIFIFVTPMLWMTLWNDLGFLLGCFYIWGLLVVVALATVVPGQVDNIGPGVAIFVGWLPYVLVYGPIYCLMKVVDLSRESLKYGDLTKYVVRKPSPGKDER